MHHIPTLLRRPHENSPLHTANNHVLPTCAASRLGVCVHPCPFAADGGSLAVSRGYPVAPDIHEGVIILSILVGFTDAQKEGGVIDQDSMIILRRSSIWKYAFRAWDVVGEFVRVLVEGEGGRSSLGCVVSSTRWFGDMPSPRWAQDIHRTRSLLG